MHDGGDPGRGHTHPSTHSAEHPAHKALGVDLLRSSFSEPHNCLPAFVPQLPPPALPDISVLTSCFFPEESRASNQTLGKQFFSLQLHTLILPKLILQISTQRPRLCPRIPQPERLVVQRLEKIRETSKLPGRVKLICLRPARGLLFLSPPRSRAAPAAWKDKYFK